MVDFTRYRPMNMQIEENKARQFAIDQELQERERRARQEQLDEAYRQEQLALNRQALNLREQGIGSNAPAALQLTNAYLQAKEAGDETRANAIAQFAKTYEAQAQFAQPIAQQRAMGADIGKATAEAQLDLPRIQQNAEFTLKAIQDVKNAPGLSSVVGLRNTLKGALPFGETVISGTPAADAQTKIDQLRGKTFLEAYNSLRGGGQITEAEGAKATNAIARLQTSQSEGEFRKALNDLESVVTKGVERARTKAGGLYQRSEQQFNAKKQGIEDPLGIR